jgi:ATP-binding protein involved in chromosome partitioning
MTGSGRPNGGDDRSREICDAFSRTSLPGLDGDLMESGVVADVDVHDDDVTVVVDPDAAPETDSEELLTTILDLTDDVVGASESIDVERRPPESDITGHVDDFDRIIAVASAKGGVGKSTVATNLAVALATESDGEIAVFDADVHGPNVPRLLDIDGPVYSTDDGDPIPVEYAGLEVMSVGLLESDVPLAWRGAMAHDAVSDLFADTAWRSTDTLIVDLPPGTGDVVLTTLQEVPVNGIVVVTQPFHTSVTDTNRTIDLFRDEGIPVLGAVLNMASFTCEHCGGRNALFEDGRDNLRTELLAELPFDREFQGRPTDGSIPDRIHDLAEMVIDEVDAIGSFSPDGDTVNLRGLPAEARRETVRARFAELESGETFRVVSDRDPTPVKEFLATLAEVEPEAIEPFEVERKTPDAWVLTTEHP